MSTTVELNEVDQNDNEIPVADINKPAEIKVDSAGNIYIADLLNHRIVKADVSGRTILINWGWHKRFQKWIIINGTI